LLKRCSDQNRCLKADVQFQKSIIAMTYGNTEGVLEIERKALFQEVDMIPGVLKRDQMLKKFDRNDHQDNFEEKKE
jgi:hypothetical protein